MEWFFDGIGTEIISLIIGVILGGGVGYKVGIKRTTSQKQVAGDNSKQRQEMKIGKDNIGNSSLTNKTSVKQSQRAGKDTVQIQIGGVDD